MTGPSNKQSLKSSLLVGSVAVVALAGAAQVAAAAAGDDVVRQQQHGMFRKSHVQRRDLLGESTTTTTTPACMSRSERAARHLQEPAEIASGVTVETNPCPGVGLAQTDVGATCYVNIWAYFGCTTGRDVNSYPHSWVSLQSYETLLYDTRIYATSNDPALLVPCYGGSAPEDVDRGLCPDATTSTTTMTEVCVDRGLLQTRWAQTEAELFGNPAENPCPGVPALTETGVGEVCFSALWKYYGCTTPADYNLWVSRESYQQLMTDTKVYATSLNPDYAHTCYKDAQDCSTTTTTTTTVTPEQGPLWQKGHPAEDWCNYCRDEADCNCWGAMAGGYTCGARIHWVNNPSNLPDRAAAYIPGWPMVDAEKRVYSEFPSICSCPAKPGQCEEPSSTTTFDPASVIM